MLLQNENKCWSIGNSCGTEIVFFTSSNNHHCNSMSSQSNRNWASTTPGKFLSSLLYLRSKPLVSLQALLKVQLLQNVWGGMRVVCLGLGVREQVPDSPKPHKQHLANGVAIWNFPRWVPLLEVSHRRVTSPSAQPPGDLLWCLWLIAGSSGWSLCYPPVLELCHLLLTKCLPYCISCWVWCSFAPRLVSGYSSLQRAVQPPRGTTDGTGGTCGWLTERMPGSAQACHAALPACSC